ncbi:Ankyrin repeat and zinc finger domain-containing protein 1, partial [Tinamus guttatus]
AAAMPAPQSRSVFEAARDPAFLHGLALVAAFPGDASAAQPAPPGHERAAVTRGEKRARGAPEVPERMFCSTCAQAFDSREEQTEHYRLDWHRFNLKQRLRGRRALPADSFEEKTRSGDVSSISGSDSESSDSSSESDSLPPANDSPGTPQIPRSHKVLFRNARGQLISAYRCVLGTGQATGPVFQGVSEEPAELVASLQSISASARWVVLMMGGGHFAGAVFQGPEVQEHKTFHRYTVHAPGGCLGWHRAAAGQRSRMGTPRCPPLPPQEIQDLLAGWAHHLQEAERIFLRAPRQNRALLFGGRNPPLTRGDPRVQHIPLSTRRATLWEVLREHGTLTSLQVYGKDTPLEDVTGTPRKGWHKGQRVAETDPLREDVNESPSNRAVFGAPAPALSPPAALEEEEEDSLAGELEAVEVTLGTLDLREFEVMPKRNRKRRRKRDKKVETGCRAEETDSLELATEPQEEAGAEPLSWASKGDPQAELRDALFTACKTGDVGTLRHLLAVPESGSPAGNSEGGQEAAPCSLLNQPVDERGCTLLHVAARAGKAEAVYLLLEAGADPALRDRQEQPPYCVSADKPTRNAFRKFVVDHPDRYDYSRAKVPGPLTPEMEAKKLEKKRAQKAQRKQREQAQREERQRWEQEQAEKQRFAALSDREKRALAAERRLAAQLQDASSSLADVSRCWQCGESLSARIPFHYLDFSFCSTACLQTHRRARASHT